MSFVKMVEVWRGPLVESMHFGTAAVANDAGEIIAGWGDVSTVTFPRSALKPIQAIALVETGAYAARRLTPKHLALACASHYGEPFHVRLVSEWLDSLGLDQGALVCGPDHPFDSASAAAAVREGHPAQRIYNNCSGKHCGFLTVAKHCGWALESYAEIDHPAQQFYLDALSEFADTDARELPRGIDGCVLPAVALPVSMMAVAMARFAGARGAMPARRAAVLAIHDAMRGYPEYVSGSAQPGVEVARVTRGRIVLKSGAEGFMLAYLPGQGLAAALKIADGEARARVPAMIALLAAAGLLSTAEQRELAHLAAPPVLNTLGAPVGRLCACGFTPADPARDGLLRGQ